MAIVGPTAAGKSALALKLATAFNGEIVSADSRQLYRGLDIGTAKPRLEDLKSVPHHLIDVAPPDAEFNLAFYQRQANQVITDIFARGQVPFLVGGSGQYVWALLEGWRIPTAVPNIAYREELGALAARDPESLYQQLLAVDPDAAAHIDARNLRRVIRALEVQRGTGSPFSQQLDRVPPPFEFFIVGLTLPRAELYSRIDRRVEAMLEAGLVAEVRDLLLRYDAALPAMSSIGYREIAAYLRAEITITEATRRIQTGSHRYARQQYNWFRLKDERINWFNGNCAWPEIRARVGEFLGQNKA